MKGIKRPTPIASRFVWKGHDRSCIYWFWKDAGSGKVFVLPLIMHAVQEETRMPIAGGEGPFALVICPSQELAQQTFHG
jgi:ATP-dependent RNA helicase DDX41